MGRERFAVHRFVRPKLLSSILALTPARFDALIGDLIPWNY